MSKVSYQDKQQEIDEYLEKRRNKWRLNGIVKDIDYDDVKQIIKLHIYKKWPKWNQKREFGPWVNRVISNQLQNLIRNKYWNFVPPCHDCEFNLELKVGEQNGKLFCGYTPSGYKCSECPRYAEWETKKQRAYNMLCAESYSQDDYHEKNAPANNEPDVDVIKLAIARLTYEFEKVLSDRDYNLFVDMFINGASEKHIVKTYFKSERSAKTLMCNFKKRMVCKAKEIIAEKEII